MAICDFQKVPFFHGDHVDRPTDGIAGYGWISEDTGAIYLGVGANWVQIGASGIAASNVSVEVIGTPTYDDAQDMLNLGFSAGWLSGGGITDNLDGTIDIAEGTGLIRTSDSSTAPLKFFDWAQSTGISLTDGQSNYVYVDYNAGSPQIAVTTTGSSIRDNERDKFELYEVVRNGTTLHIIDHPQIAIDVNREVQRMIYSLWKVKRADAEGGLILSETGTRNIGVSAGKVWVKLKPQTLAALDTSVADTFDRYYQDGLGGWTEQTGQTQWDNAHYDDGSGVLASLTSNWYTTQHFYEEADGSLVSLFGQAQYATAAGAEGDPVPSSIPLRLQEHGLYLGRFIVREGGSSAIEIQSAFDTVFSTTLTTDHGNLTGLGDDDHAIYALLAGRAGDRLIMADDATTPPWNMTQRSSPPASPLDGDIYNDDGTNTASGYPGFRRYDGGLTAWEDMGAVSGAGTADPGVPSPNSTNFTLTANKQYNWVEGFEFTAQLAGAGDIYVQPLSGAN